ncbi:hypothetical protein [Zoogloea sp.]|uniref:hypothetical protein n=1 Tax=Zoogloea sp. TaxID=49181 RepID=UPI002638EE29|nr:hypothetical protein [Zoogloea sp.]
MAFALKKHSRSTRGRRVWTGKNAIQINGVQANIPAEKSTKFVQCGSLFSDENDWNFSAASFKPVARKRRCIRVPAKTHAFVMRPGNEC